MKLYIYPHDMVSEGSKELSDALSAPRIRRERSQFKRSARKVVINWGNSRIDNPEIAACRVINTPESVTICANKLTFFNHVNGKVRTPPFTTDPEVVKQWLEAGKNVCARTILRGSGANGLVVFDALRPFVKAPLWTQYVPKRDEYRIHVAFGNVIDVQQKKLKQDLPEDFEVNWQVRNLDNGFIYARENVSPPQDVLHQATLAVNASGLDFGAADVIYNSKRGEAYVLEINTAPGLQGTTVDNYSKAFKDYLNSISLK